MAIAQPAGNRNIRLRTKKQNKTNESFIYQYNLDSRDKATQLHISEKVQSIQSRKDGLKGHS